MPTIYKRILLTLLVFVILPLIVIFYPKAIIAILWVLSTGFALYAFWLFSKVFFEE